MSEQTLKTVKSEVEIRIQKEDLEQIVLSSSLLVQQMTLTFTPEGLSVRMLDPSHVAMIHVSLPNSCFEKYLVEQDLVFAVNVDEFLKTIKIFDKNSWIDLRVKDEILVLSRKSEKYKLRLVEPASNDTPLPKIPYDSNVTFDQEITVKDFIKQTDKINIFSDYITLKTTNNIFKISGKGDSGEAENSFEHGQVSIRNNQDSEGTYSFEYVKPYLKTVKDLPLTLEYSSNKPLRLDSKLANIGRLHFYLAPRVES
ncbi:MAG: DNA polymerase sliding clamp [Candidatus Dadabacteria bacterium]|nr:DNA polymerase sliding clamp [Candidatus Dadabacteria bacterium]